MVSPPTLVDHLSHVELQNEIAISSLKVNGLLRNIDEIELLIQEENIHILAVIEVK